MTAAVRRFIMYIFTGSVMYLCALPSPAEEPAGFVQTADTGTMADMGYIFAGVIFVLVLAAGIFRISRYNRQDRGMDDK